MIQFYLIRIILVISRQINLGQGWQTQSGWLAINHYNRLQRTLKTM